MPISHNKKAVFVHIPKTAGTTVEKAFGMQNSESLYCTKYDERYRVCPQHLYADEILNEQPNVKDYFWFTIVRNPFDRLVSEYHYINTVNCRARQFKGTSFEQFINNALTMDASERMFLFDRHLELQSNFINDAVHVYKFEHLHQCFEDLKQKFKIPFFDHERKSIRQNTTSYYNNELIERVRSFYQKDFTTFEYECELTK